MYKSYLTAKAPLRRIFTSPWLVVLLLLLPIVFVGYHYNSLPDTIPIHFNAKGEADGFGKRSTIWVMVLILTFVSLGIYLLIANIHRIDPRKAKSANPDVYKQLAFVVLVFMTIVQMLVCNAIIFPDSNDSMATLIFAAMGLLFAAMGYLMRNVPPNYFIGLRLPWTLEDDQNWAATHRVMSVLWVVGGGVLAILAFLLSFTATLIAFFCVLVLVLLMPVIYSYQHYKRNHP